MKKKMIITGGAGFIGINASSFFLKNGYDVTIFDNLSRPGSKQNIEWLHRDGLKPEIIVGDVRNPKDVTKLSTYAKRTDGIIHLAAQVAVTTSVVKPYEDFEINALGTFNILELMRTSQSSAKLIYASTNKVYGSLEKIAIEQTATKYKFKSIKNGIDESFPVDFHSPYGCSKGSADQYVHDYSRIYGLDTVVFRQSCIYGPHQFGIEDQGWVAWFMIAMLLKKKISIYGSGKQVRDLLYVDDLIDAYHKAFEFKDETRGKIYNIGGGLKNSLSIWYEFIPKLQTIFNSIPEYVFENERPGDQPIYISNFTQATKDFQWTPKVGLTAGLKSLSSWLIDNIDLIKFVYGSS